MFGLVVADINALKKEDKKTYNSFYCGLCCAIGKNFNNFSRITLNYDLTFLYLFLTSYFDEKTEESLIRCGIHPLKKKNVYMNKYAEYCACMNILLTYYKFEDDVNDEGAFTAKIAKSAFKKQKTLAQEKYPIKNQAISDCLKRLNDVEKQDEHNADIPANIFGELMGILFDINGDDLKLREFGKALGKVIYIMDAVLDFKSDLKKCRYNPLIETKSQNFQQILTILLNDCVEIYDTMNITKNKTIIDNILFSGIWYQFRKGKTDGPL
ncbi:MAG: hypothetical protein E7365_03050 [Clostridiales bacterium]|nr:hypothetical protein [Clostridiales bacterium]